MSAVWYVPTEETRPCGSAGCATTWSGLIETGTYARLDDGFTADDDEIHAVHDVRDGAVEDDRAWDAGCCEDRVSAKPGVSSRRHK